MSWSSVPTVLGALVLSAGLVAVGATSRSEPKATAAAPPTVVTVPTRVELPAPVLEGIDPAIQRVLYDSGAAQVVAPSGVAELPVSVARVLAYYGATLTIPLANQGGHTFDLRAAP